MVAALVCRDCNQGFEAKRSDALRCVTCHRAHRKEYLREYEHGHRRGICPDCGRDIAARANRCRPCENKIRVQRYVGGANPNWRNGRTHAYGYTFVRTKTGNGGGAAYTAEHRLVWEAAHGPLPEGYVVHHLNGIKEDNRLENLAAMARREHNPRLIVAPYEARIKELEERLASLGAA